MAKILGGGSAWLALALLALGLSAQSASAGFYSTMDTGKLLAPGHYKLGAETQFITEGDDGVNLGARIDGGIDDEWGWRGLVGFGTTDVFLGAFAKWVPIPDVDNQPAVGALIGVVYANYGDISELTLRVHPFVSKAFEVSFGDLTPYASLPLGLRTADGETDLTSQIVFGTEFRPGGLEKINFLAEIGFDIDNAFPYFSIGATLEFDEDNGIEFK